MSLAVGSGGPTTKEVERLRLILSTYQDGSGMLWLRGRNLPGWRDFERTVSHVFEGRAVESKAIFDVLIPSNEPEYGISCKMRGTLDETTRTKRITIELSNSSAKFNAAFKDAGITDADFRSRADDAGKVILGTVAGWHAIESEVTDLERSSYLSLSWNLGGDYQLHQFGLEFPASASIVWSFPNVKTAAKTRPGRRLQGEVNGDKIIEFYYGSGGQLKYYPHVKDAIWTSSIFRLESLDAVGRLFGPEQKAAEYFPEKWKAAGEV